MHGYYELLWSVWLLGNQRYQEGNWKLATAILCFLCKRNLFSFPYCCENSRELTWGDGDERKPSNSSSSVAIAFLFFAVCADRAEPHNFPHYITINSYKPTPFGQGHDYSKRNVLITPTGHCLPRKKKKTYVWYWSTFFFKLTKFFFFPIQNEKGKKKETNYNESFSFLILKKEEKLRIF